ncbi:unnamed protein product [Dracunculus medinensis]|uniref:J domain-containing protein n=1 Tax=Dracunculus medinensis TaxID=318479 RepID=A0A0N4UGL8_DRAME|nr:unnamed protein product [Dracunculus medinensis]
MLSNPTGSNNWRPRFAAVRPQISRGMPCYYEILGLERDVDEGTIRKSYRRLALLWHPDKNPGRVEECTKQFALIQEAYEVLSDPHERAWYDRHREQILRRDLDEHYEDNSLNLFPYFSSNCYSGFDDADQSFYTIYRRVFETIANEDYAYIDDPSVKYPTFGYSNSSYIEIVGPFYGFWQGFCTSRTFSWLNKYDTSAAPNRTIAKAMEKENRKYRDEGKKKRNEEIRELISFVRKRDKRVQQYKKELEERRIEQHKKAEENRKQMIQNRLNQLNDYKETDEIRQNYLDNLREIEEALDAEYGEIVNNIEDEGSLYCILCEKAFKSQKAMANHLKSKKHKETLLKVKEHLKAEDVLFLEAEMNIEEDLRRNISSSLEKKKNKKKSRRKESNLEFNDENNSSEFCEERKKIEEDYKKKKKKSNKKNVGIHILKEACTGPKIGICDKCSAVFESRSKLFMHLEESGHASLKISNMPQKRKQKAVKKKR